MDFKSGRKRASARVKSDRHASARCSRDGYCPSASYQCPFAPGWSIGSPRANDGGSNGSAHAVVSSASAAKRPSGAGVGWRGSYIRRGSCC